MKKPYLKELQSQLLGSVTDTTDARNYFSTDASIFTMEPEAIVYPKNTADVRKTVQLLDQRARDGKVVGIIPRGSGTDQSGGAIGEGLQLVFPAHMNRILRLGKDTVTVQPGVNYRTLQQTLHTHGRFLPPYPSSIDYSTIGGAVANNAGGEKSVKYGVTRDFVKSLKVVLSDGTLIETKRISKRELGRKLGKSDLEGQIYRKIDRLIEENEVLVAKQQPKTSKNAAGYSLSHVKRSDGSINLSELIVGSQGTLGIVTEITLRTSPWNPRSTLVVGYLPSLKALTAVMEKMLALKPSSLELVDSYLLENVQRNRPQDLEGLLPVEMPKIVLLAEFDDFTQLTQTFKSRRAEKLLVTHGAQVRMTSDPVVQEALWKIRHSVASVIWMNEGPKKALPFIEDGVVPVGKLSQFLDETYQLMARHNMDIAVWGHAGDANLHMQPQLDLAKKSDVEKLFEMSREFHDIVIKLGGTTTGSHNDGIIRGPYLQKLYGDKMYALFEQVKAVFDPHGIMNPGKKLGVTEEFQRAHLRTEYSMKHLYDHMPRT
jgi:FAD/FMN-containing dehydrogenase